MGELLVIALGGNAILRAGQKGTYQEQLANVSETMSAVADLIKVGHRVVITHGNGPQVGNILIQQSRASEEIPPMPLDVCGSQTQGQIGYMIQQCLHNQLVMSSQSQPVVALITQVEVDPKDAAFQNPSKPIGPFYDQAWAEQAKADGLAVIEDAGRGYRRVVPSPHPIAIVEAQAVRDLVEQGTIVIASGGGGIPVVQNGQGYQGVEAVIDKDRVASLIARTLGADRLVILTDVDQVAINFNTPKQQDLSQLSLEEAQKYLAEGQFAAGSMGPKIEAAIEFVQSQAKPALITSPRQISKALVGDSGTVIET